MKIITSVQNPEIKLIAQLADVKERYKQGRFIAEGERVCHTLLQSPIKLDQLYIIEELLSIVRRWCDERLITVISPSILKKISQATTPSGIIGIFKIPPTPSADKLFPGIVLAQISDPGNMGTLIRTCAALGKKTIITIEGVDPWNPKVVQASAGTIGMVNVFNWEWDKLLKTKKDLKLAALIVKSGKRPEDVDLNTSLLVIGSEAHGIPIKWLRDCDEKITLAMPGDVESLNAAVAGSIAMYLAWVK